MNKKDYSDREHDLFRRRNFERTNFLAWMFFAKLVEKGFDEDEILLKEEGIDYIVSLNGVSAKFIPFNDGFMYFNEMRIYVEGKTATYKFCMGKENDVKGFNQAVSIFVRMARKGK